MTDEFDVLALLQQMLLFKKVKAGTLKKMYVEPGKEKKGESPGIQEKHLQFVIKPAGDVIVRQGELDTEFFIVIEGIASAYRTESDGRTHLIASYGQNDFFGEMSAISHQPRSATVKADSPTTLIRMDSTLFQLFFQDKTSSFAEIIDSRYRQRALAFHLLTAPLFRNASPEDLAKVAARAELVSYAKDQVITHAGDEAEAVYLVRSGIVKRSRISPSGQELVHDYLCDNSSFGEQSLTENEKAWAYNNVAMSHVDLVKMSVRLFREIFVDEESRRRLQTIVNRILAEQKGAATSEVDDVELLVGRETVKGTEALVIDLAKCTRCNACVESCVAVHEDGVPRLSKRGIKEGNIMLSSACYNCKIPECMLSCKFGAIRRDKDGQIHIIDDNCTGCSLCEKGCPYGVIRMANVFSADVGFESPSPLESIPLIGGFFRKKPRELSEEEKTIAAGAKDKAIKCDLCAGLPFEACVYNCPCEAIERRNPETLGSLGAMNIS